MPLTRQMETDIQNAWYQSRERYELLAEELHRLLDHDQRFPHGSVYTVKHRLKSQHRLIEKLDALSPEELSGAVIDAATFQDHIADLLGMRVICLRVSDLEKVQQYLSSLQAENSLLVLDGPTKKETFILRPPKGLFSDSTSDLQYSGYSSIHYIVKLGPAVRTPRDLSGLRAELQVRTILEEAWGEIDHKYRYEIKRSGNSVPQSIESGFRDLALYLQAAAHHAEHLCEEAEKLSQTAAAPGSPESTGAEEPIATSQPPQASVPPKLALKQRLGFEPSPRTVSYCLRRIAEHAKYNKIQLGPNDIQAILTNEILDEYREIYSEVCGVDPFSFSNATDLDANVVPLINFALFSMVFPKETTRQQLTQLLRNVSSPGNDATCSESARGEHPKGPTSASSGHE
ncbi:MAG: GTP pyrophosphokinase family protein [Syntrophobacteraceae bacterium]